MAKPESTGTSLGKSLRRHRMYLWIVAVYSLAAVVTRLLVDDRHPSFLGSYAVGIGVALVVFAGVFLVGNALVSLVRARTLRDWRDVWPDFRLRYLERGRLLDAATVLAPLPLLFSAFTAFKAMIPTLHFYRWDRAFAATDRWLHGGVDPWRLLQPILGHPHITSLINALYHLWLPVLLGMVFWQAFSRRDARLRMQFLLTFSLTWMVIGTVAATLLSSAGPVYFSRLTGGPDIYEPLMNYLRAANLTASVPALEVQEILWRAFRNGESVVGMGISAMPSMHMATAFLFALSSWRTGRVPGSALTVFALFIFLGSVHLGWHYAIDSYVAIALTWLIWAGVGRALDR